MSAPANVLGRLLRIACAVLALNGCGGGASAGPGGGPTRGEYIVTLRPDADIEFVHAAFRDRGLIELRHLFGRHYLLRLSEDPGLEAVRARMPETVEAVQPNYEYRTQ